jgi:hypothetical protein
MGNNRIYGICAGCDRDNRSLHDVGAYDASKFCGYCIKKFGVETLKRACNAALALRPTRKPTGNCLRCDAELILDAMGKVRSLHCADCDKAYQERFGSKVKWQS